MAGIATIKIVDGVASGVARGAYSGMAQATEKVILNSAGIETSQQRYDRYRDEAMRGGYYGQPAYAYPQGGGYVHLSGSNHHLPPRRVIVQQPAYSAENYAPAQVPPGYHERGSLQRSERQESLSGMEAEYQKELVKAGKELDAEKDKIFNKYVDSSGKSGEMSKEENDEFVKRAEEKHKSQVETLEKTYFGKQEQTDDLGENFENGKWKPQDRDDL
ncbi:MAG: hypothetical protein US15_C0066G0004 [Candidatus Moranbacteria bacterium GW2011_GWF1_36_4]|nr:MAG: hypothetical protein US15_C0066G0004 [Candidatus Moranbacteria bacterium GW2011_GWF1_36_4]